MAETKRQSIKTVDGEKLKLGIYLAKFKGGAEFVADLSQVNDEMKARFMQYGLKQKLDDAMAGADDEADAIAEVTSTWESIVKGQWTLRVAGEGVEGGLFARAYAERHGIPLSDAKAKIGALVEKNTAANNVGKTEEKDKVTERQVFNRLRDVALERDADLKAKYDELKAKKAAKTKEKGSNLSIEM